MLRDMCSFHRTLNEPRTRTPLLSKCAPTVLVPGSLDNYLGLYKREEERYGAREGGKEGTRLVLPYCIVSLIFL